MGDTSDEVGRVPVGILGATGTVGQTMIRLLQDHPWFEVAEVGASESSAGMSLADRWEPDGLPPLPARLGSLRLQPMEGDWTSPLLLSALPASVAGPLEPALAARGHLVVSNASAHRMHPEAPLIVPEVNPDHLSILGGASVPGNPSRDGGMLTSPTGGLLTNPNCAVAGLVTALAPLHREFGLERAVVTTFQAISGAGRPGPPAGAVVENVLPFIGGEESKFTTEPQRILGTVREGRIAPATFRIGATATRVPVLHGHLVSVSAAFGRTPTADMATEALRSFRGELDASLPSAPSTLLQLFDEPDRPQPRLDRDLGGGMTVSVGRVRPCEALDLSFIVLAHNLIRGAAGAAILNAELCHQRGRIPSSRR